MRKLFVLCLALAACGCEKKAAEAVAVPTTAQLMADNQLLSTWQGKCNTGEYSQLPAAEKDNMCFTTREATRSLAVKKMNGI
ncbi:hypothetical protein [Novosphingobium rosa]|uniref:hypothetical protein n=1 Tax=Novosphingobium rosa TaxID=76978 RepID=UPI00082A8B62|nr:hypothetical protein [Novosphingobium rosa]